MAGETSGATVVVVTLSPFSDGGETGGVESAGGFHAVLVFNVSPDAVAVGEGVFIMLKPIAIVRIDKYFKLLFLLRPTVKIFYWANDARGVFDCYFHCVVKFFWAYFFATFKVAK